jgi:hypothetical protein
MHGKGTFGDHNNEKSLYQNGRKGEWFCGTRVKWLDSNVSTPKNSSKEVSVTE